MDLSGPGLKSVTITTQFRMIPAQMNARMPFAATISSTPQAKEGQRSVMMVTPIHTIHALTAKMRSAGMAMFTNMGAMNNAMMGTLLTMTTALKTVSLHDAVTGMLIHQTMAGMKNVMMEMCTTMTHALSFVDLINVEMGCKRSLELILKAAMMEISKMGMAVALSASLRVVGMET